MGVTTLYIPEALTVEGVFWVTEALRHTQRPVQVRHTGEKCIVYKQERLLGEGWCPNKKGAQYAPC
jgi:hypothetical protein